jgi:prepilin-type N-terminal cleavage/methylation domain-containing protein/prepilin-type processing-associated H-X9-DG protein
MNRRRHGKFLAAGAVADHNTRVMARHLSRRLGFTLIELLVVIAIIAIVLAMLLPALNKARRSAHQTACLGQLQNIGQALFMYAADNRGQFPGGGGPDFSAPFISFGLHPPTIYHDNYVFLGLLYSGRYLSDARIFYCPSSPTGNFDPITYENRWFKPPSEWTWSLSSYSYRIFEDGTPPQPRTFNVGRKDAGRISILADVQVRGLEFRNHRDGSSVWYADGHAKWVPHEPGGWVYLQWWVQPVAAWEYFDRQ